MAQTVQQRLDDAQAAYHDLMTGRSVVEVRDQNGETVRYNSVTASKLAAYIADLERQLGTRTTGPMQVWF